MKQRAPLSQPRRPLTAALAAAVLCASIAPAPLVYAQQPNQAQPNASRFKGEPVTLNFVNADIEGVSRAMGAILKQQFIVDPRVKGNITLFSEEPLSPREAYLNFLAALRGLGFTVVEVGGLFKIVPEADAKLQSGTVAVGGVSRQGDQVLTQIFKLSHENANNLVPVLRPLISPNNTINANPGNNTLIITDYADNLNRIAKIIAAMDTPSAGDVEIVPLKYAVATDLAAVVQRLSDGGNQMGGIQGGATSSILVDSRSNSLIVRASTPARMTSIRSIIEKLDQPTQGDNPMGNIYVVYLKNADATKLATVLRAAYGAGGGGGGGGSSNVSGSTLGQNLPQSSSSQQQGGLSSAATTPVSASASPSTGGMIQADPSTNALIITAPEPVYRQLRAVIEQLDARRAQVYIESMIVEVTGDNTADFGFQWQGLIGKDGDKTGFVGGTNFGDQGNIVGLTTAIATGTSGSTGSTAAAGVSLGKGFNFGVIRKFAGAYNLAAIANLLQTQANTNIVSTPNLVTLDNEEAKIVVGSNVPFITGSFSNANTSGTTNPFQTIERKDVGITLRLKPQIGENGAVRMTIFQESSDIIAQAAGTAGAGPSTSKRSIESTIVVDDGEIVVLGGLIQDKFTENNSKVPLLGDIPLIGSLFRSQGRTKARTNLMVFLRPIVLRDAASSNNLANDRYEMMRAQQLNEMPKRSWITPINEAPLLPTLPTVTDSVKSLSAPPPQAPNKPPRAASPAASEAETSPVKN